MKIINNIIKENKKLNVSDVVNCEDKFYMIILDDEYDCYRYLNLQNGQTSGDSYDTLEEMERANKKGFVVEAELHIK